MQKMSQQSRGWSQYISSFRRFDYSKVSCDLLLLLNKVHHESPLINIRYKKFKHENSPMQQQETEISLQKGPQSQEIQSESNGSSQSRCNFIALHQGKIWTIAILLAVLALTLHILLERRSSAVVKIRRYFLFSAKDRALIEKMQVLAARRLTDPNGIPYYASKIQSFKKAFSQLEEPSQYLSNEKLFTNQRQLPLCLVVQHKFNQTQERTRIVKMTQSYQNVKIVQLPVGNSTFLEYYDQLANQCNSPDYFIVVFFNGDLQSDALATINKKFQIENIYAMASITINGSQVIQGTPAQSENTIGFYQTVEILTRTQQQLAAEPKQKAASKKLLQVNITAVHSRVLELIKIISDKRVVPLQEIPLAVLELCAYHISIDNYTSFFAPPYANTSNLARHQLLWDDPLKFFSRPALHPLHSLDQDHIINYNNVNEMFYDLMTETNPDSLAMINKAKTKILSILDIFQAQEYQQLLYQPKEHLLWLKQQQAYDQHARQYGSPSAQQTRFCITVLNRNNIQHNRYAKAIKSLLQQNYSNYHIVFIDDASDDDSLTKAQEMFKELNFSEVQFVQNLQRRYGTYNIINAAYNFCKEDQVQVLFDGDDQLIGTLVLKYLDLQYQDKNAWVVYSMYKCDNYLYGYGQKFSSMSQIQTRNNGRLNRHIEDYMSPIRSWRVPLVRSIPLPHHRFPNGTWFQVGYDNAIQLPLFELAGAKRVKMVRKILYLAHVNYGSNDNTEEKIKKREKTYDYVRELRPLGKLRELGAEAEVRQWTGNRLELRADEGRVYRVVHL